MGKRGQGGGCHFKHGPQHILMESQRAECNMIYLTLIGGTLVCDRDCKVNWKRPPAAARASTLMPGQMPHHACVTESKREIVHVSFHLGVSPPLVIGT